MLWKDNRKLAIKCNYWAVRPMTIFEYKLARRAQSDIRNSSSVKVSTTQLTVKMKFQVSKIPAHWNICIKGKFPIFRLSSFSWHSSDRRLYQHFKYLKKDRQKHRKLPKIQRNSNLVLKIIVIYLPRKSNRMIWRNYKLFKKKRSYWNSTNNNQRKNPFQLKI